MFSKVHFFQTLDDLPGFFDSFFNGFFLVRGLPTFFQIGLVLSFGLCLLASFRFSKDPTPKLETLSALAAFCTLVFAAFLLFQPWDELFINLRHAQHLALSGNFSFNQYEKIEGIVDFLPFFILGFLHRIGLPLVETNFVMEILAGWFCILAGRKILFAFNVEKTQLWSYPLLVLFPPLLLNTGNGFTVLLFTAFISWALVFLVFDDSHFKNWFCGCLLLSFLPLIRLEGIWFCFLLFVFLAFHRKQSISRGTFFASGILVVLPTVLLSLWRISYYGRALPVPVLYKSSFGNVFFTLFGIRNFFLDLFASGSAFFLLVFGMWALLFKKNPKLPFQESRTRILWILLFFSIPYYLSGGDWFPPAWGRYLFPFSFFCFLCAISVFSEVTIYLKQTSPFSLFLLGIISAAIFGFPSGSLDRVALGLFSPKTSLSGIHQKKTGQGNYRIHYLSRLGIHLKETTPRESVVGSSEVATIMFFSEREALDLLGVTNIELAESPLRETPRIFSKVKIQNELPHLIFKRTNPGLLYKKMPGIFYAFDFMLKDLIDNYHSEELTEEGIALALKRWEYKFKLLNDSLFWGLDALKAHGYEPVVVKYGTGFCSLYFVSSELRENHFTLMKKKGLTYSFLKNSHLLEPFSETVF